MKDYIIKKRVRAESAKHALELEATADVVEIFVEEKQDTGGAHAVGFNLVGEPD